MMGASPPDLPPALHVSPEAILSCLLHSPDPEILCCSHRYPNFLSLSFALCSICTIHLLPNVPISHPLSSLESSSHPNLPNNLPSFEYFLFSENSLNKRQIPHILTANSNILDLNIYALLLLSFKPLQLYMCTYFFVHFRL